VNLFLKSANHVQKRKRINVEIKLFYDAASGASLPPHLTRHEEAGLFCICNVSDFLIKTKVLVNFNYFTFIIEPFCYFLPFNFLCKNPISILMVMDPFNGPVLCIFLRYACGTRCFWNAAK